MAEKGEKTAASSKQPEAAAPASAPKMVRAKIVTNYGRHRPGEWIEVTEREYLKFRKDLGDGKFECPVFISQADIDLLEKMKREAEEARLAAQRPADERARGEGWLEYQREAQRIVEAKRIEEQQQRHAALLGTKPSALTAEQQEEQFRRNIAASRGG